MKKLLVLSLIICAFCVPVFSQTKSMSLKVPASKIEDFLKANPDLPDFDKSCLMSAEFKVGIRTETLKLMYGEPKSIKRIKQPWAEQEEWFYKVGKDKLYFTIENGGVVGIEERK
jgi:hypothetical protein